MNKLILILCIAVVHCSAADKPQPQKKVTIISCYSSMNSKVQKHEIVMSDGRCITLKGSLSDPTDVRITLSQGNKS